MLAQPADIARLVGKKILVVEDEESIRNYLKHVLSSYRMEVETAADADLGLACLREKDFDIVLTDFRLPKVDGVQFFENVRTIKPAQAKCFVFMTGDTEKKLNDFFEKQQVAYLMKPFLPDELVLLLQKVLDPPTAKKPK